MLRVCMLLASWEIAFCVMRRCLYIRTTYIFSSSQRACLYIRFGVSSFIGNCIILPWCTRHKRVMAVMRSAHGDNVMRWLYIGNIWLVSCYLHFGAMSARADSPWVPCVTWSARMDFNDVYPHRYCAFFTNTLNALRDCTCSATTQWCNKEREERAECR